MMTILEIQYERHSMEFEEQHVYRHTTGDTVTKCSHAFQSRDFSKYLQ